MVCCLSSWIELFSSLDWSNKSLSPLEQNQPDATQTQSSPAATSLGPCWEIRNLTGVTIMSGLLTAHSKYMVNRLEHEELVISRYSSLPVRNNRFLLKMLRPAPSMSETRSFIYLQVKTQIIKTIQTCKQLPHGAQGHPTTTVIIL